MKHKCPAELNSRVIRINLDTYQIIRGLSLRDNITMDEALTKLITGLLLKPVALARSHKILTPVTTARSIPVTTARSTPIAIARRRSTPVTTSFSREVATNGHREAERYR
ncbi:hypothetical protein ES708_31235 [subsurface metagenome]